MGVRMTNPFAWAPGSEPKYFVWVNEKGTPYPQLWYGEREKIPSVLFIKRLEPKHESLPFNELVKLFPYTPPKQENEK